MHFFKIKNIIKFLSTNLIVFSMISNSLAGETSPQVSIKMMQQFVSLINSKELKIQDAVAAFQKIDVKKAKELEEYLKANPELQKIEIPKATIEENKISFMVAGVKTFYTLDDDGKMVVSSGNKKVELNYSMPIKEMVEKISKELGSNEKFSLINLIIQDSHAIVPELAAAVIAILAFAYIGEFKEEAFVKSVEQMQSLCMRAQSSSNEEVDLEDLKNKYNELSEKFLEVCAPGSSQIFKGYEKKTCNSTIPLVKQCFRSKITEVQKSYVSSSSKKAIKEIQYNAATDKYLSVGASK